MEKIIKGKIFNTEKSEKIAKSWIFNIHFLKEELVEILYKTKKWEYFLYSYTINVVNEELWKLWEKIKIMNLYEILNWFEKNQINFNETERKSFFKEFWKFFMEA